MTFSRSSKARNIVFNAMNPSTDPETLDYEMVTDKTFDDLQQLRKNLQKAKDPDRVRALENKIKYIQMARSRV